MGEIIETLDSLERSPLLSSRKHPSKNIRWLYPKSFPYRVVYEVIKEQRTVIVAAVLHGAQDESVWRSRFEQVLN